MTEVAVAVTIFTAYNPPPPVRMSNWGKSKARQSEADACNINMIMARYEKTGVLPVDGRESYFADVSQMGDYRTALHHVQESERYFMSLPAELRLRFENDTAAFLDFVSDPENRGELVELGLIEDTSGVPPVVEEPVVPAPEEPAK